MIQHDNTQHNNVQYNRKTGSIKYHCCAECVNLAIILRVTAPKSQTDEAVLIWLSIALLSMTGKKMAHDNMLIVTI
jgi:hypothetical protein